MVVVDTIKEYDKHVATIIKQAKEQYPNWKRYELAEDGTLYLWSLGAYPSIIKNFCERFGFEF